MKLVCPFCKGRIHTVYIRSGESGKTQFVGLGNYFWCAKDEMIFVPTSNLVVGRGQSPPGREFMGNAKRLVPQQEPVVGPSPMKPARRVRRSMTA